MVKYHTLIWLLAIYVASQLLAIYSGGTFLVFVYLVVYLMSIFYGTSKAISDTKNTNNLKPLFYLLLLFLIANLILSAVYVPTLLYNSSINWKLKGETEVDPMMLQVYVPPILFAFALLTVGTSGLITKIISCFKRKSLTSQSFEK